MKKILFAALVFIGAILLTNAAYAQNTALCDAMFHNGSSFVAVGNGEYFSNSEDEDKLYYYDHTTNAQVKISDEHIIALLEDNGNIYLLAYADGRSALLRLDSDSNIVPIFRFDTLVTSAAAQAGIVYFPTDGDFCALTLDTGSVERLLPGVGAEVVYFDDNGTLKYCTESGAIHCYPQAAALQSEEAELQNTGYTPRLTAPAENDPYYTTNNVFHTSGYGMVGNGGNCTCYAYGRSYENLGSKPNLSTGNAGLWFDYNTTHGYYASSKNVAAPALGAVVVWKYPGNAGHVAVVEVIDGTSVTTSESGWNSFYFKTVSRSTTNSNLGQYSAYVFDGYIYVMGTDTVPLPPTHTVYFNANGGSCGTSSKTVTRGEAYGELPEPIREYYDFAGWFTDSTGGTQVTASTNCDLNGNQTLYAHWVRSILSQGSCGANASYLLYADGEMEISGTGEVEFGWDFRYDSRVRSVSFSEGITAIADSCFSWYNNLQRVTFPNSLQKIGQYAFGLCNELLSVTIPANVDFIGEQAFANCSKIAQYTIDAGNLHYYAQDGILFEKDTATLLQCPCCKEGSYTVPDGIKVIGMSAFAGCDLSSVVLPNSVETIVDGAFDGCSNLESVNIPESVTLIGHHAFSGCENLKEVHISDLSAWCNIEYGGRGDDAGPDANPLYYAHELFLNGERVENLVIPDGIETINGVTFVGCTSITSVVVPESVTSIGYYAFYECSNLVSFRASENLTRIGYAAFYNCSKLATIEVPGLTELEWDAVSGTAWYQNQPEGVIYVGKIAYEYRGDLPEAASISLRDGTKTIGEYLFYNCINLTNIEIPDSVEKIGGKSLRGTTWYENLPEGLTYAGKVAFLYKNTSAEPAAVTLRSGTVGIAMGAFSCCHNLTGITIPDSVTYIGDAAFEGCSSLTSITIPNGVTSIGGAAFAGCNSLTSITIPNGVTSIGGAAFEGCNSLTSITIPDGVAYIGDYTFEGCSSLTSITIPNGVISIGYNTFAGCSSLTSITIPDSVTYIGVFAFEGCSSLTSITIPNGVTGIDYRAFAGCSSLKDVYYQGDAAEWEDITIADGNDTLESAVLHSPKELESEDHLIAVGFLDAPEVGYFSVHLQPMPNVPRLVCAAKYVDGQLLEIVKIQVDETTSTGTVRFQNEPNAIYKVILVDDNCSPCCAAWSGRSGDKK